MTKEEFISNNILIAEFDNWKRKRISPFAEELDNYDLYDWEKEVRPNVFETNYGGSFSYNTSWDWILPVYKKLSDKLNESKNVISKSDNPKKQSLLKHINDCDCTIRCHICDVRIDETFFGIAETIKLYNTKFKQ